MIFLRLAEACSATGATKKALRFYEEAYKRSPESNRYSVLTSYLYCMVSGNTSPADMLKGLHKMDELFASTRTDISGSLELQPKPDRNKIHVAYMWFYNSSGNKSIKLIMKNYNKILEAVNRGI